MTSWAPNNSRTIHCGAAWLGATLATHFEPRLPSTARAGAYWPPSGDRVDDALAPATATRRMPGATQSLGMSWTWPAARSDPAHAKTVPAQSANETRHSGCPAIG